MRGGCPRRSSLLPLTASATYNSLGHLSCTLCNAPVKSELLWQTHALGKQHREVSWVPAREGGGWGVLLFEVCAAVERLPGESCVKISLVASSRFVFLTPT